MTTDDLLMHCSRFGITLSVAADRIRFRAPIGAMTSELRAELAANRDELVRRLPNATHETARSRPSSGSVNGRKPLKWSLEASALVDFVLLLTSDDLPPTPFTLSPGCEVCDRDKFLASLQADAQRGPNGPRARDGALQNDLRQLRDILIGGESSHDRAS